MAVGVDKIQVQVEISNFDEVIQRLKTVVVGLATAETRMARLEERLKGYERQLAKAETDRRGPGRPAGRKQR